MAKKVWTLDQLSDKERLDMDTDIMASKISSAEIAKKYSVQISAVYNRKSRLMKIGLKPKTAAQTVPTKPASGMSFSYDGEFAVVKIPKQMFTDVFMGHLKSLL